MLRTVQTEKIEAQFQSATAQVANDNIDHIRYAGDHTLTQERFDDIVRWLVQWADWSRVGEGVACAE